MNFKLFGRKSAEVISFVISTSIILAIFIYLGLDHARSTDSEFLEISITVQKEKIRKVGDHFLVPVELENKGFKTPALTVFSIDVGEEERIIQVDYLSKQSSKTVFVAYRDDPTGKDLRVQLQNYQL